MNICDHDCFHCKFDDCICDDMTQDDYAEARERDFALTRTAEQKKIAAKQKAYREANRDEIAAYQKAYYEANRDEIAAKQKAYREANRDEIAARQKAYREANRDELAAYQKAYYEANRDEIAAKNAEIKALRKRLKLSQKDVAMIVGVSRQLVGFWETGCVECFRFDEVVRKLREIEAAEGICGGGSSKASALRWRWTIADPSLRSG